MRAQGNVCGQFGSGLDAFGERKSDIIAPFLKYCSVFLPAW